MSKLRSKLEYLNPDLAKKKESTQQNSVSNRERLEKLVNSKLKNKSFKESAVPDNKPEPSDTEPYTIYNYFYSCDQSFGAVQLNQWNSTDSSLTGLLGNNSEFSTIQPDKWLFFDTETTGLSGGTGTLPFMYGFGWLEESGFSVSIFMLNNPAAEEEFLDEIEKFISSKGFEGIVTYNGKSFDIPLTETRLLLHRKKSVLPGLKHLDFLYPARTIWKNTYESRKLGYLGDILLGISREDDIDGSLIPSVYNSYIRTGNFSLIEKVIEHNALDLVGLNALLLLALQYAQAPESSTQHNGEHLGIGILHENHLNIAEAERIYNNLIELYPDDNITRMATKRLADLKKRQKLFNEAEVLWGTLKENLDKSTVRELAIHYEHREQDPAKALAVIESVIHRLELTTRQREDMEKRIRRLKTKID